MRVTRPKWERMKSKCTQYISVIFSSVHRTAKEIAQERLTTTNYVKFKPQIVKDPDLSDFI